MIEELCTEAIWLDHGQLIMAGPIRDVAAAYHGRSVISNV
jgi:ABC-type polysaccharide/polyol phosphate transport system ATPase subunit